MSQLVLKCKKCDYVPSPDTKQEAFMLHFKMEHDSEELEMELVAQCSCGEIMRLDHTTEYPGVLRHVYVCPGCGGTWSVRQKS